LVTSLIAVGTNGLFHDVKERWAYGEMLALGLVAAFLLIRNLVVGDREKASSSRRGPWRDKALGPFVLLLFVLAVVAKAVTLGSSVMFGVVTAISFLALVFLMAAFNERFGKPPGLDLGYTGKEPERTLDEGHEVSRWHLAAKRANEGRDRRSGLASGIRRGASDNETDADPEGPLPFGTQHEDWPPGWRS